jgi:hypothetical protein
MVDAAGPCRDDVPGGPRPQAEEDRRIAWLGLAWLRRRLEDHIKHLRSARPQWAEPADEGRSRFGPMSDLEADWLLHDGGAPAAPASPASEAARRAYQAARDGLTKAGTPAALDRLSALFGLAPFDEDLLLLAAAPRLEAAFAPLYGYAHDRLALEHATPHLARALLVPPGEPNETGEASVAMIDARLSPAAPLRRYALIDVAGESFSVLAGLAVDERIAAFLVGLDWLDPGVKSWLRPARAGPVPARLTAQVEAIASRLAEDGRAAALLVGPPRSGRRACAAAVARRFGLDLLELDAEALAAEPGGGRAFFSRLAREARLAGFALLLDLDPAAGSESGAPRWRLAERLLLAVDAPLFLVAEAPRDSVVPLHLATFRPLDAADRAGIWRETLGPHPAEADPAIEAVAEQFALGPAEIWAIARERRGASAAALWRACRQASMPAAEGLAERIEPRFEWDDIVLPPAIERDLRSIAAQACGRATVYGRWGFGRKLVRGRGVTALFAGSSGVGKTMAAEVIARDLDLDLHRVDLAGVVSKYIGETEKNLRRVFEIAEAAGAILFFDEADALFGKRSEVKDSHDRYANVEVSYLLQRMESFCGVSILATNLKSHLDTAFLRRLRYVVDFPFPNAALRRAIWARALPEEAPRDGIDLDALARIEMAGGSIAVVAVNAAFLAVEEGAPIGMAHIARAAEAELRKHGKEPRLAWLRTKGGRT